MDYRNILISKEGQIGFLTLNRPEANNLLNLQTFNEIIHGLDELDADDDLRVIIVRAAGPNFSMGADLAEIMTLDEAGCHEFFSALGETYHAFRRVDKVTIGMVQGYCTAGGMGLATACDLVVAAEDAQFGATAVKAGLF